MTFFSRLLTMIVGLLTSKKFVTGAITAVATAMINDTGLATKVAAIGTSVVLGFAAQDAGKEKAKIEAAPMIDPGVMP